MNSITIAGNLGKDCELRFLGNGDPVASFSVADSAGRDKPTIWWNCSMFGKRAEALTEYLRKGTQVTVIGSVAERVWNDKDGQERKSMDVRVSDIKLQGGSQEQKPASATPQRPSAPPKSQGGGTSRQASGFDSDDGSDVPF